MDMDTHLGSKLIPTAPRKSITTGHKASIATCDPTD